MGAVYTVLALHIETTLDPAESAINRSLALPYIHQGILVLRAICEQWSYVKWTLRLFEWVLTQKNIPLPTLRMGSPPPPEEGKAANELESPFYLPDVNISGIEDPSLFHRDPESFTDELLGFDFMGNPDLLGFWN